MSLSYKRDSLTNFRAQKARENLREMGAEEIRRASEKNGRVLGEKRYSANLFRNILFRHRMCCFIYKGPIDKNNNYGERKFL